MPSEITIPKSVVILVGLLGILALAAGIFLWQPEQPVDGETIPIIEITPTAPPASDVPDPAAQAAAIAGAQAFYSVDTTAGPDTWVNALCAVSTQAGCSAYQNVIVPAIWPALAEAQVNTTATAQSQGVEDAAFSSTRNAETQVLRLQVELSEPWPIQSIPDTQFSALALVIQENQTWKFERFLTDDELAALAGNR